MQCNTLARRAAYPPGPSPFSSTSRAISGRRPIGDEKLAVRPLPCTIAESQAGKGRTERGGVTLAPSLISWLFSRRQAPEAHGAGRAPVPQRQSTHDFFVRGSYPTFFDAEMCEVALRDVGTRLTRQFSGSAIDCSVPVHIDDEWKIFFGTIDAKGGAKDLDDILMAFCQAVMDLGFEAQAFAPSGQVASTPGLVPGSGDSSPAYFSARHFPDLGALLAYLRKRYDLGEDAGKRHDRTQLHEYDARPRYLFRGESDLHWSTQSSMWRMMSDMPAKVLDPVSERINLLLNFLQTDFRMSKMQAWAFMQHYGLPSLGVDFSRNLTVSAAFAQLGRESGMGAFAVLDMAALSSSTSWSTDCQIEDITNNFAAWRTMRQEAVWVSLKEGKGDLKDPLLKPAITWYTFDHSQLRYTEPHYVDYLYYDLLDEFNQRICRYMDSLPKMPAPAATWFADKLGSGLNLMQLVNDGFFGKNGVDMNGPHWTNPRLQERVKQAKHDNYRRWSRG